MVGLFQPTDKRQGNILWVFEALRWAIGRLANKYGYKNGSVHAFRLEEAAPLIFRLHIDPSVPNTLTFEEAEHHLSVSQDEYGDD